jgi:hypothetical protein
MKPRGDANVRALSDRRRAPCRCDWSSGVGRKAARRIFRCTHRFQRSELDCEDKHGHGPNSQSGLFAKAGRDSGRLSGEQP